MVSHTNTGNTTFYVNNEMLFQYAIKEKESDGHFGLRLLSNHILLAEFQIHLFGNQPKYAKTIKKTTPKV